MEADLPSLDQLRNNAAECTRLAEAARTSQHKSLAWHATWPAASWGDRLHENPKLALACRHQGRAQAQGGRDLRQHRRRLQAVALAAGPRHPEQAAQRFTLARTGAPLQEAQGR